MDMDESIPAGSHFTTDEALKKNEEACAALAESSSRENAWLSLRQIMVSTPLELTQGMSALAKQLGTAHLIRTWAKVRITRWIYAHQDVGAPPVGIHGEYRRVDRAHTCRPLCASLSLNRKIDLYARRKVSACHCAFNNYTMGFSTWCWRCCIAGIAIAMGSDGAATRGLS